MVHVVATITVKKGKRKKFLKEFHKVKPKVLKEKGCIEYGPTVDVLKTGIAAQGKVRTDVVVIVEKWKNLKALKAHLVAPHMALYREKVRSFVHSVSLAVLEPA
ncbi:MAG: antibiotic biosynthesis monooxygenase [Planctomycetota bacterium]|nr:antibiotic biosynthesis monooxygenase [Planctomycetota bacterium]